MFDPNFDPLAELEKIREQNQLIISNHQQIARAFNEHATLLKQITQHLEEIGARLNIQDKELTDLHNRVRLLETVRQYENKKPT